MDFHGYMRKEYEVKFLKFFSLEIISEDREDGTYKHFINVYFFNKLITSICFRTGVQEVNHIYEKNYYMGYVTKGNKYYDFHEGDKTKEFELTEGTVSNTFSSKFKDVTMSIVVIDNKSIVKNIDDYYMKED